MRRGLSRCLLCSMIEKNLQEINKEIVKLSNEKITMANAQNIALLFGAKLALKSILEADSEITLPADKKSLEFETANNNEYFPSFKELQKKHNTHNLQKVCVELQEFCILIYSTLKTEEEKNIFMNALQNII